MKSIFLIAGREIQEALRNRWVMATTLLMAALALTLTALGSAPAGTVGVGALDVVIVSLSSLSIFLLPLIALILSHDAIVGEAERGTLLLLLSYPVKRSQIILGKFAGHTAVLGFATLVGYGAAALLLLVSGNDISPESWLAFFRMIGSSVALGMVFVALGYLVSCHSSQRSTAGGIAIGVWLLFVLLWDMVLMGVLVADQGRMLGIWFVNGAMLTNPADVYRLLNLGTGGPALASGLEGVAQSSGLSPPVLFLVLLLWMALPLGAAIIALNRRQA